MKRATAGMMITAVASLTFNAVLSGAFQNYVRTGLRIPLLISAVVLAVVGIPAAWPRSPGKHAEDGHGHGGLTSRMGFMLLLPVLLVFLVAPSPLGAFAAGLSKRDPTAVAGAASGIVAIEPGPDGVIDLTIREFLIRSYNVAEQVDGTPIRLLGFVAPDESNSSDYLLTRFTLACCAADSYPLQVAVRGVPTVPAVDAWVELEGEWSGDKVEVQEGLEIPVIDVTAQTPATQPAQPYDY